MGPIKYFNLCIAPAFYLSQVDICGPFGAYSSVNKRAALKSGSQYSAVVQPGQ